ncbi:polyketide synthase PksR [Thermoflavimicrobium dichotomicum]|uniref:Polyketide synthase PksR n=1 Tax=Thermoflavimicrobium dichotomicum TaxID=46223 RepID=A0A1I3VBY7_9BACL|nr:polyketide synthase PksR [Thermoflavimicrobium dichotomicum]
MLFSSGAGVRGNLGQADYAAANAFLDGYARYRSGLAESGERQGQTVSINWPLWQEGGMRVDGETEKMMQQTTGMKAMETSTGIRALYQAMASGREQVLVAEGDISRLKRSIRLNSAQHQVTRSIERGISEESLESETVAFIKQTVGNAIKISPEKIDVKTSFDQYGVDSILQINVIRELEKVTGELPKTLLFEHSNTQELANYLVANHSDRLLAFFHSENQGVSKEQVFDHPDLPKRISALHSRKPRVLKVQESVKLPNVQESEDIAVIGISGRYPMSKTLEELWEHLRNGRNCISEAPKNRWNSSLAHVLSEGGRQDHLERYYGGFLDDIDRFDHQLFGIAPEQVWELSPELRLFLEIVWETFEDAGYNKHALQEYQAKYGLGIGVFVGTMYSQYPWSIPSLEQAVLSSNATDWQIANRTSHFFNLTGPSIAINSACSSSLTAIHLACESLKQKSCSMAIAGGVNLTLDPSKYKVLDRAKFLGSGNKSKSFGAGDGYIPGEGVGAVLLKPLSLAKKDGDRIDAVIKSSFINHSGGRQMYSAPDPKQQAKLVLESIRRSGIDPLTISYVESAANGSELGDPIEIIALTNAFRTFTDRKQYCALGSVKSNIGHLEAASGISQLTKVILQFQHKTLVPTINADPINPNLKLENTPFYLQRETIPWDQPKHPKTGKSEPRRSMINSFGAGGAYANVIIEEFTENHAGNESVKPFPEEFIFVFSAKTKWSLNKYLEKMRKFLEKNSLLDIGDVAYSLQRINHQLEQRVAIVAKSNRDLIQKLDLVLESREGLENHGIYVSYEPGWKVHAFDSSMIQESLEKGDIRKLAQYWVMGETIDFGFLFKERVAPPIRLPHYAFEHRSSFSFQKDYSGLQEESDEFYQTLFEKVISGELTEEQFKQLIMMGKKEEKWIFN